MTRVLFVGGLDRSAPKLLRLGELLGVEVEHHNGDQNPSLDAALKRADRIVVFTGICSHPGALKAREHAKSSGKPIELVDCFGMSACKRILFQAGGSVR